MTTHLGLKLVAAAALVAAASTARPAITEMGIAVFFRRRLTQPGERSEEASLDRRYRG
jgi:hypothetical protein